MEKLYDYLPQQLVTFILVTLFSLLIGFIPTENQPETRGGNYAFRHRPDFYFYRHFGISPLYT